MGGEVFALRALGKISAEEAGSLSLELLPRALRRGLSEVMKLAIAAAGRALSSAGLGAGAGELPIVYGSAFGESRTAVELLTSITAAGESSPVLFRHSVHNAAPGLLSIALGTTGPASAVAAGEETALAALLEACALLREGAHQVLVVLADDAIPAELGSPRPSRPQALAFVLARSSPPQSDSLGYVSAPERGAKGVPTGAAGPGFEALAEALTTAFASGASSSVSLSSRQPWRLRAAAQREALR
jgi:hypothetical protein